MVMIRVTVWNENVHEKEIPEVTKLYPQGIHGELAAYLRMLNCYVSNDSGPMHLAWAQHTPVTALFGPTVRELGFFPRGDSAKVFEVSLECRPCGLHGPHHCPKKHHRCMVDIDVEAVWRDVAGKLGV